MLNETKKQFKATIPFPPSVNHMYGARGKRRFLKPEGVLFYATVKDIVGEFKTLNPPYKLTMRIYMPDRRKRDGGNLLKATEDSMTKSGVIFDDKDIVEWHIKKCPEIIKGGKVEVVVEEM